MFNYFFSPHKPPDGRIAPQYLLFCFFFKCSTTFFTHINHPMGALLVFSNFQLIFPTPSRWAHCSIFWYYHFVFFKFSTNFSHPPNGRIAQYFDSTIFLLISNPHFYTDICFPNYNINASTPPDDTNKILNFIFTFFSQF